MPPLRQLLRRARQLSAAMAATLLSPEPACGEATVRLRGAPLPQAKARACGETEARHQREPLPQARNPL